MVECVCGGTLSAIVRAQGFKNLNIFWHTLFSAKSEVHFQLSECLLKSTNLHLLHLDKTVVIVVLAI